MTLRDLRLRVRALLAPRRVERELDDELAFHITRETDKLVAGGMTRPDAIATARARFGSVALAADECRDARGIGIVDAAARDVVYALRTFARAPLVALTVVATVALGLGLVAAVFTLFNMFAFRVDAVRDPHELFGVQRVHVPSGQSRWAFTRPDYEALRRDTDVFAAVFAMLPDIDSRIDGRMMGGTLVTGNFFEALGVGAALGRTLTPADDDRAAGRPAMVLSHRGWSQLFERDPAVIGRTVLVQGFPYQIVGVMPEGFRGLSVGAPDYWAPLSQLAQFRPIHIGREDMVGIAIVGRLRPGLSPEAAQDGLAAWASVRTGDRTGDRRQRIVTLEPRRGTIPISAEMMVVMMPLFFTFGLILLIGCANVANLLLARAVARQREIGIRLSLGASRRRIVRQLLTESPLLALAAAAFGVIVSRLVLDGTVRVVMTSMAPELVENFHVAAPALDWRVVAFIIGGALVSTLAFGLVPALQATRLELLRIMRGEVTRDARPGRARDVLIGVQVAASTLLLIGAAVFLRSTLRASAVDPGIRTTDTVLVDIVNEPRRAPMLAAVTAEPAVVAVAGSSPELVSRPKGALASAGTTSRVPLSYRFVTPEYFSVLDIPVRRGRTFTSAEGAPGGTVAIVSETVARTLWPQEDAVGRVLHLEGDPADGTRGRDEPTLPARAFTVVGVVRDVAGFRLGGFEESGVYLPTSTAAAKTSLILRVHGDPEQARHALLARLTPIDPNMGSVMTLRTLAGLEAYFLKLAFWLTLALGALALLLTLAGLFSVLSYLVEQRTKEIAVRMALGATLHNVAGEVLAQSFRPVGVGLAAGAGMAVAVAMVLMATPLAAGIGGTVQVFDPLAYAASLLVIVVACALAASIPALRAARIDPMRTLRQE